MKTLYVIQAHTTGAIKVGVSSDPRRRLSQLQTGSPHRLRILLVAEAQGHREKSLHSLLSKFRTRHAVQGEWFSEESIGSIPMDLWALVPEELLEDPDWWKRP